MNELQQHGEPSSESESTESHHFAENMDLSPACSSGHVKDQVTLESIAAQLNKIQINIDTLREQRYDERNELVAYINDLLHMQNETLDLVEGVRRQFQYTNDNLYALETQVEHIDYHMHVTCLFICCTSRVSYQYLSFMCNSETCNFALFVPTITKDNDCLGFSSGFLLFRARLVPTLKPVTLYFVALVMYFVDTSSMII